VALPTALLILEQANIFCNVRKMLAITFKKAVLLLANITFTVGIQRGDVTEIRTSLSG
jgi:hypothetical protein